MSLLRAFRSIIAGDQQPAAPQKRVRPPAFAHRKFSADQVARGFHDPTHRKGVCRVVVTADEQVFAEIRGFALAHQVRFAEAVRQLIASGLSANANQSES